jgi:hypothetical protein
VFATRRQAPAGFDGGPLVRVRSGHACEMLVLSRVVGTGHGRVSEFCYFVTFAVTWTLADPGHIQVHPYSNRYSNPLKFGAVCERPPTFTKRLELRKLDTHTRVRTHFV